MQGSALHKSLPLILRFTTLYTFPPLYTQKPAARRVFVFSTVFSSFPKPLPLVEVAAKQTERAKALTGDPKHSDIIALPKAPAYRAAAALGPQACPLSHLR